MRPLFTQEVLHQPRGPFAGAASQRRYGPRLPPPLPPRVVPVERFFAFGRRGNLFVLAFGAGFIVGSILREAVLLPWLQELEYNDPRITPPLGELEPPPTPTNWGGANQPSGGAVSPEWWPTGYTTDLPNYPSLITLDSSKTNYQNDENGEEYVTTIQNDQARFNNYVVGSIGAVSEVLSLFGYRITFYNISPTGVRNEFSQFIGNYSSRPGGFRIGLSPLAGPSPGRPYPAAPSSPGLPNPFRPAPEEIPRPRQIPALPGIAPQPNTTPATKPQTLPQQQPARPTLPTTPGIPQTVPRPVPAPAIPAQPATTPRPVPVPIPLLPNFQPAPAPLPPVTQAPAGLEVPWPSADPIGQPSKRPPPTLTGIATELGKLEQKVAQIGARGPGFDVPGLLEAIGNLINDPPEYNYPAGEYTLPPICERDSEGRPLPAKRAQWPSGSGEIAELRAKLDALAKLVRFHKEWKQPICPPERSMPQGQPVSVTFEQIPTQP